MTNIFFTVTKLPNSKPFLVTHFFSVTKFPKSRPFLVKNIFSQGQSFLIPGNFWWQTFFSVTKLCKFRQLFFWKIRFRWIDRDLRKNADISLRKGLVRKMRFLPKSCYRLEFWSYELSKCAFERSNQSPQLWGGKISCGAHSARQKVVKNQKIAIFEPKKGPTRHLPESSPQGFRNVVATHQCCPSTLYDRMPFP